MTGAVIKVSEFELRMTSYHYPEQYDIYRDDVNVGYVSAEDGWIYAYCPAAGTEEVYTARIHGKSALDKRERGPELLKALDGVRGYLINEDYKAARWSELLRQGYTEEEAKDMIYDD